MPGGVTCDYCGKQTYMPYRCRYCNGLFCPDHRLPEKHDCTGLERMKENPAWKNYAIEVRKREAMPRASFRERWDREETSRTGSFRGPGSFLGSPSVYQAADVEGAKRMLVVLLLASLVMALMISFL